MSRKIAAPVAAAGRKREEEGGRGMCRSLATTVVAGRERGKEGGRAEGGREEGGDG